MTRWKPPAARRPRPAPCAGAAREIARMGFAALVEKRFGGDRRAAIEGRVAAGLRAGPPAPRGPPSAGGSARLSPWPTTRAPCRPWPRRGPPPGRGRRTPVRTTPSRSPTTPCVRPPRPPCRPPRGGAAPDLWERLAAPFAAEEVRSRRGPRGDLRYITARVARRRLTTSSVRPTGPAGSNPPSTGWRCSLTIILPDGRAVTREAVGGYPDMPAEEDRVKGGDSDAFKRACVLFGIGEYLYGDEPAEPPTPTSTGNRPVRSAEMRGETPPPTSNGNGRGSRGTSRATASASPTPAPSTAGSRTTATSDSPRRSATGRISRPRSSTGRPSKSTWPPSKSSRGRTPLTAAARGRGSPGLGVGDAASADWSEMPARPMNRAGRRPHALGRRGAPFRRQAAPYFESRGPVL